MFHLDELLKLKTELNGIENFNALPSERIGDSPYVIEKTLHRSNDSFVYLAFNSLTNRRVVIKEFYPAIGFMYKGVELNIKRSKNHSLELIENTVEVIRVFNNLKKYYKESADLLKGIDSKYIVDVNETFECNHTVYVVMAYLPYPTLSLLMENKVLLPRQIKALFESILHGMKAIHKSNYIIKSLSPTNIYMTDTHIIIGDFNMLKKNYFISETSENKFIAPEVINHGVINLASDCYSLGRILEYMLSYVDFKTGNSPSFYFKGLEPERLEYLLSYSLNTEQDKRVQTVDEITALLNQHIKKKRSKIDLLKLFIAAVLVIVAIATVRKSGILNMIPIGRQEIDTTTKDVVIEEYPLRFVTKRTQFDFSDTIQIRWVDKLKSKLFYVHISCDERSYDFIVDEPRVNLTELCLNPGEYKMRVKNDQERIIEMTFQILAISDVSQLDAPVPDAWLYGFYQSESKEIKWSDEHITKVRISDLNTMNLIGDFSTESDRLDLSDYVSNSGDYLVTLQSREDSKKSLYTLIQVTIYSDDELKDPILSIENGETLGLGDEIHWSSVETGTMNFRWVSEDGVILEKSFDVDVGSMVIDSDFEEGVYELFVTHTQGALSSQIVNRKVYIVY